MCEDCKTRYSQPTPAEGWRCGICGNPINEGDEYAPVGGQRSHMDCLREVETAELLEMCGVPVLVAFDCLEGSYRQHDPEVAGI